MTVVIPAFNGADFIREAILSCLSQMDPTFSLHVLVVDDGSTDQTRELVASMHKDVTLVRHEINQGRHAARNTGLLAATGHYVKFLDQDDLLQPDTLRKEFELAIESNADIIIGGHRVISIDENGGLKGNEILVSPPAVEPRVKAVLDGAAVPTAAALYRRSYITGLTWAGDVPRLDDWDWFVRAALRMGKIVPIQHISYSWRHHSRQYTHSSTQLQYACDHHTILGRIETWLRENGEDTQSNMARLAQYYYKMLRVIYKHDRRWYRRSLRHIFDLDPTFFPHCEPRSDVRKLCRMIGVRPGLFVYNHAADAARTVREWIGRRRESMPPSERPSCEDRKKAGVA